MTDRFVGPGGSDGNSGLTWALRKLTLNGVEDTPVVAGDTIYVGPGVYRETLATDVSGSSGNPITYIGDVSGRNTDGIGGLVRITGLNADTDANPTRLRCIDNLDRSYRTFVGFYLESIIDSGGSDKGAIRMVGFGGAAKTNITIRDCIFGTSNNDGEIMQRSSAFAGDLRSSVNHRDWIFERNIFFLQSNLYNFNYSTSQRDWNPNTFRNNFQLIKGMGTGKSITQPRIQTTHVRNNTWLSGALTIWETASGGIIDLYDNVFIYCQQIMDTTAGVINDDYNILSSYEVTENDGANNVDKWWPMYPQSLYQGIRIPWDLTKMMNKSHIWQGDDSALSEDMYGLSRPSVTGKRTPGAIQFREARRDGVDFRSGISSIALDDTSRYLFHIPLVATDEVEITAYVKRETDYTGVLPQLVIKRPGEPDITVTDTGAVNNWNKLTHTWTVGASDRWAQIELKSNNTALSGSFQVNFDDIEIKQLGSALQTMRFMTDVIPIFVFKIKALDPWLGSDVIIPNFAMGGNIVGPFPTHIPSQP